MHQGNGLSKCARKEEPRRESIYVRRINNQEDIIAIVYTLCHVIQVVGFIIGDNVHNLRSSICKEHASELSILGEPATVFGRIRIESRDCSAINLDYELEGL
jgi:hypothetical protein